MTIYIGSGTQIYMNIYTVEVEGTYLDGRMGSPLKATGSFMIYVLDENYAPFF